MGYRSNKKRGFSLVEVVIATSVLLITFLSSITVFNYFLKVSSNNTPLIKAGFLLEEGIEAVKILRDTSWTTKIAPLSTSVSYYLVWNNGAYVATSTYYAIDTYERKVVFDPVYRDSTTFDIVSSGGTLDPDTKKVTVSVSWWNVNSTTTKEVLTYVTNMFGN